MFNPGEYFEPLTSRASTYMRPLVKVRGLPLNCDVCNHPFQAGNELIKHMTKEHKVKTYDTEDCDYCEMEFKTTEELLAHAELDNTLSNVKVAKCRKPTFKCDECEKVSQ